MKPIVLLLFCWIALSTGQAQTADSLLLNKDFIFEEGVYLSFGNWQQNRPDIAWENLDGNLVINPRTGMARVEYLRQTETGDTLDLENAWGLVYDGTPYIRLPTDSVPSPLSTFAAIKVRGKLCFFSYETRVTRLIPMAAVNPVTGTAFRRATVERTQTERRERLLDFGTGEIVPFNQHHLLQRTADDRGITRTIEWIEPAELSEKLYKCLLIYDDRNPVYVGRDH